MGEVIERFFLEIREWILCRKGVVIGDGRKIEDVKWIVVKGKRCVV